jgi:hypothetical protein
MRRLLLVAMLVPVLAADPRQEVFDLLGVMASGLSENDPSRFLAAIDPSMKGYDDLGANVRALVEQVEVMSTIEPVDDSGDASSHTMRVDWLLQLRNLDNRASVLRRQKVLTFRFQKQKRKWRVASIEPLDFFAPPRTEHP